MLAQRVIKTRAVPETVRILFHKAENAADESDHQLWREVCARAVLDACGLVEAIDEKAQAIADARAWFLSEGDWEESFLMAGIDGPTVINAMRAYINAL
jgi:hypothetical protein